MDLFSNKIFLIRQKRSEFSDVGKIGEVRFISELKTDLPATNYLFLNKIFLILQNSLKFSDEDKISEVRFIDKVKNSTIIASWFTKPTIEIPYYGC